MLLRVGQARQGFGLVVVAVVVMLYRPAGLDRGATELQRYVQSEVTVQSVQTDRGTEVQGERHSGTCKETASSEAGERHAEA